MRARIGVAVSVVLAVMMAPSEIQAQTEDSTKQPIVLVPEIMDSWNQKVLLGEGEDEWRFFPGTKAWDKLIAELEKQGYTRGEDLFVAHYDWTASFSDIRKTYIASEMQRAREANGSDTVKVVGHGIGGLLARSYIAENENSHGISHLVFAGTPHYGMMDMFLTKEWGLLDRGWNDHQKLLLKTLAFHKTQAHGGRETMSKVFADILPLSEHTTPLFRGNASIPRTGLELFSEYQESPSEVDERRNKLKEAYENSFLKELQNQEFLSSSLEGVKVTNVYDDDGAPSTATRIAEDGRFDGHTTDLPDSPFSVGYTESVGDGQLYEETARWRCYVKSEEVDNERPQRCEEAKKGTNIRDNQKPESYARHRSLITRGISSIFDGLEINPSQLEEYDEKYPRYAYYSENQSLSFSVGKQADLVVKTPEGNRISQSEDSADGMHISQDTPRSEAAESVMFPALEEGTYMVEITGNSDAKTTLQANLFADGLWEDINFQTRTTPEIKEDEKITYTFEVDLENTAQRAENIRLNTGRDKGKFQMKDREQTENPIVLVHGIMGAWHPEKMGLSEETFRVVGLPKFNFGNAEDKWVHLARNDRVFQDFVNGLEEVGYRTPVDSENPNVFMAYYDWRQSNAESAREALAPAIEHAKQETGAKEVDIVAHSMGGLVARSYINQSSYNAKNVDRLVMAGTPNQGSATSIPMWLSGDVFTFSGFGQSMLLRWYLDVLGEQVAYDDLSWFGSGNKKVIHMFAPALRELLPSYKDAYVFTEQEGNPSLPNYPNTFLGGVKERFLGEVKDFSGWKAYSRSANGEVELLTTGYGCDGSACLNTPYAKNQPTNLQDVEVMFVAGTGQETVESAAIEDGPGPRPHMYDVSEHRTSQNGDGRVLADSVKLPCVNDEWSKTEENTEICKTGKASWKYLEVLESDKKVKNSDTTLEAKHNQILSVARQEVFSFLDLGSKFERETLNPLKESFETTENGFYAGIHSPADITVTFETKDGKTVTLTKDTPQEVLQKYNARYISLGAEKSKAWFVSGRTPQSYTLTVTGTATGEYTLKTATKKDSGLATSEIKKDTITAEDTHEYRVIQEGGTRSIRRINKAPKARMQIGTPRYIGRDVTFDASSSTDREGSELQYRWQFGERQTEWQTDPEIEHTWNSTGEKTVSLTVKDTAAKAKQDTVRQTITVTPVPARKKRRELKGTLKETETSTYLDRFVSQVVKTNLSQTLKDTYWADARSLEPAQGRQFVRTDYQTLRWINWSLDITEDSSYTLSLSENMSERLQEVKKLLSKQDETFLTAHNKRTNGQIGEGLGEWRALAKENPWYYVVVWNELSK